MADTKISALTAVVTAATTDQFAINQGGTSKMETVAQLQTLLQAANGLQKIKALSSDATVNGTTTLVNITNLAMTLGAGTYYFKYMIRYQTSITTTGVKFAVHHTGTVTAFMANHHFAQELSTAASLAADQATTGGAVGVYSTMAVRATNQTAGPTASADATGDMLWVVEGSMIVTVSGDLQLLHASETAANTTVMAGSLLLVTQVV